MLTMPTQKQALYDNNTNECDVVNAPSGCSDGQHDVGLRSATVIDAFEAKLRKHCPRIKVIEIKTHAQCQDDVRDLPDRDGSNSGSDSEA